MVRRDLFDAMIVARVNWSGRFDEASFLARVFPLDKLPSHDSRLSNMRSDIQQHRNNWQDWEDDWVYHDGRLDLVGCPDATLLKFLTEMLHPAVQQDQGHVHEILDLLNPILSRAGWELVPSGQELGGHSLYIGTERLSGEVMPAMAKRVADELSSEHIRAQVERMQRHLDSDPAAAIGAAKEFLESICKAIVVRRKGTLSGAESLPKLVSMARELLGMKMAPEATVALRTVTGALSALTHGIAELRGVMGTGHGATPETPRPPVAAARLAVGAATTLAVFLFDVHRDGLS